MRLTSREREISELLRQEPLISQEDLAARLGITRSSAAVHISNLIKKGIILGKGYVFSQQAVCTVVGEAAYLTQVHPGEPAVIERKPDGLAIKACLALQNYDLSVKVFTVLGTDPEGDDLLAILSQEADVSGVMRPPTNKTRQRVQIYRPGQCEHYTNQLDNNDFFLHLDNAHLPWLDCKFLWIEAGYIPQIMPMVRESTMEVPTIVACTLDAAMDQSQVDVLIMGKKDGRDTSLPPGDNTLVITDGSNYVTARHQQEIVQMNILPGQQFNVYESLERFTAGFIYGLSRGIQLRQALRIAIGNSVYQV